MRRGKLPYIWPWGFQELHVLKLNPPKHEQKKSKGRWSYDEHYRFVEGVALYGKCWKMLEKHIGKDNVFLETRNGTQIRSHAQKFFDKLLKETNMEMQTTPKKGSVNLSQTNEADSMDISSTQGTEVCTEECSDQDLDLESDWIYKMQVHAECLQFFQGDSNLFSPSETP